MYRDTLEVLPDADHYRDLQSMAVAPKQRPTMGQLHEKSETPKAKGGDGSDEEEQQKKLAASKFGWIQGVLVRCLLNIFGVMLFLRLTWITGQAGIGLASIIILLSSVVTIITTLSMSAICTNGEVKGGGAYYMISRSLGPEFGGAIGIVFSLANAVAAAMYVVGFAETVVTLMDKFDVAITDNRLNDVRIIGCALSCILLAIVVIGMEWEAKAQLLLLVILMGAIFNYVVGTFLPSPYKSNRGFTGYSELTLKENLGPSFQGGLGFFDIFSVFFPASTGILAGANISGDLKNPQLAIPKGTLLAIVITTIVYLILAWLCGSTFVRFFPDNINITLSLTPEEMLGLSYDCSTNMTDTCAKYGLLNDYDVIGVSSGHDSIILAGIFSATLSSALASLVGAPKVFQAVCKDKLFPLIEFFGKGYGASGEPRRGYFLAFVICLAIVCIAELNVIAPIISNFFLMAYMLINFACFYATMSKTPGFRPAFKWYNKWLSLVGALLCLAVMFVIKYWSALITFVVVGGLYMYIWFRKPDVNWGSSMQAHAYQEALKSCFKLTSVEEHVKNFRPQILVLSGHPRSRPNLVDFASVITKKQSLLICGHVLKGGLRANIKDVRSLEAYNWLKDSHVKAFYNNITANTFSEGARSLLQTLGLGKMRPNVLLVGFKAKWRTDDKQAVIDYFNVIHDALDMQYGVGILRVKEGFESVMRGVSRKKSSSSKGSVSESVIGGKVPVQTRPSNPIQDFFEPPLNPDVENSPTDKTVPNGTNNNNTSNMRLYEVNIENEKDDEKKEKINDETKDETKVETKSETKNEEEDGKPEMNDELDDQLSELSGIQEKRPNLSNMMMFSNKVLSKMSNVFVKPRFRIKQKGTIDVYWLYDDGGLTLLVPYIISHRSLWKDCKLRIFCVGTSKGNINEDQRRVATLLSKFRIDYSHLTILTDLHTKPNPVMYSDFENVVQTWMNSCDETTDPLFIVSDTELKEMKHKTYRHLRLREEMLRKSHKAALIVMTLPMPRKGTVSAGLYLAWLEMLTRDMPPILLLRGNQQSVLTYYS